MRMLPAALGRHSGFGSFQDLQQRLLNAFSADIPGNGHIFSLAGNFVDFINIDNTALRLLYIPVCCLDQPQQDRFHVIAHIAGFRHTGGVSNGKGDLQDLRKRLGQIGLAASGGSQQQDIALLEFHILPLLFAVDPFVVVVHCHAQGALRPFLADDVFVQCLFHLRRSEQFHRTELFAFLITDEEILIVQDLIAQGNALIADIDVGTGHKPFHHPLFLPAEGAARSLSAVIICH